MVDYKFTAIKKCILQAIPLIFIIGALMHFVYNWSGKLGIVGIFAPINESVWEHLKLSFFPMILWWFLGYFVSSKNYSINREKWFTSAAVAIVTCALIILAVHYTYTGAFGVESLIIDIFSLLLGLTVAQFLALHLYRYLSPRTSNMYIAILVLALLTVAFIMFTFNIPKLPIFMDNSV